MVLLRKILFPFAALYGAITQLRNYFFDRGILEAAEFKLPIIAVGNLSVGGTGKSPQVEYLIRLLSQKYRVATLSRGYKRKSSGFVLADANATAESIGDEPLQFYSKFPEIQVAVDADRRNGISKLLELPARPEVILLDDAFQHRKVKAGLYILLTAFGDLYVDDFLLPTGNLRESRRGAKRAQIIVITKCPPDLSAARQNAIRSKMRLAHNQQLFFSSVAYGSSVVSASGTKPVSEIVAKEKILVAGIAKPQPFFAHLQKEQDTILEFGDHHNFTTAEIGEIKAKANGKLAVTTEKDYTRLKSHFAAGALFYLPIRSVFLNDSQAFDRIILEYVEKKLAHSTL